MNPILKNTLAVLAGIVVGSVVNGALISVSSSIIPPPNGADVTTVEGLKASIHLFEPKNYLFPFLAHALGTLIGAFIATKFAATNHFKMALIVGTLFFIGGIMNVMMLPAAMWFNVLDLTMAYFPMAWLGNKLASKKQ
jgi:hypothetical protein